MVLLCKRFLKVCMYGFTECNTWYVAYYLRISVYDNSREISDCLGLSVYDNSKEISLFWSPQVER
eukprot:c42846_g1_i1 orf=3-194(-)